MNACWQWLRPHAPKLAVSLLLAGGFAWLMKYGDLPVVPTGELSRIAWWTTPLSLVTFSVSIYFRTNRWYYLLRPIAPAISQHRLLGIGLVGSAAVVLAPLRIGEVVRPYLLSRDGEVSFTQGLSVVAAERIIDGLVVAATLLLALLVITPLSPLPDHLGNLELDVGVVHRATHVTVAVFACAFLAMAVFYAYRAAAQRLVWRLLGRLSQRAAGFVTQKLERLADGLQFLLSPRDLLPFLLGTAGYWASLGLGCWAILHGCGLRASLAETWVVVGVMTLGVLVPAGPGFFGAYQLSVYCGLAMFFSEPLVLSSGAAFVFVTFVAHLAVTLASCAVGFRLIRSHPIAIARFG